MQNTIVLISPESGGVVYISMLLEQAGYTVYKCSDANRLPQLLQNHRCDLIIIDDRKPELNAVELYLDMQQCPVTASFPTILMMAVDEEGGTEDENRFNILTRPILPHLLLNKVEKILAQSE